MLTLSLSLLLTGIGIFVSSFPMQFFIMVQRLILALGRGVIVLRLYSRVGLTSSSNITGEGFRKDWEEEEEEKEKEERGRRKERQRKERE